ncbi:MAG TPA: 50S ribosomal protein L30 [Myxococcota bacterium]|nr:50S ribosomal protein L30 [Myxococcota bacterium]
MSNIRVVLRRSTIGVGRRQRECVRALGLRRIGDERILIDTPAVRGVVSKVLHLVDVAGVNHGE